jgi:plastocyanin
MELRRIAFVPAMVITSLWLGSGPATAGGGGGCHVGASDGTGDTVRMTENCFDATVLHVDLGTTVTWMNDDLYAHTVTGVGGTWGDFTELEQDDTVSYRFEANGVYVYSCIIHPGMVGAVVVGDGSGDAGLAPAVFVPQADADTPGGTLAETSTTSGDATRVWTAAISGLLGIAIGFALARARARTGREIAQAQA